MVEGASPGYSAPRHFTQHVWGGGQNLVQDSSSVFKNPTQVLQGRTAGMCRESGDLDSSSHSPLTMWIGLPAKTLLAILRYAILKNYSFIWNSNLTGPLHVYLPNLATSQLGGPWPNYIILPLIFRLLIYKMEKFDFSSLSWGLYKVFCKVLHQRMAHDKCPINELGEFITFNFLLS